MIIGIPIIGIVVAIVLLFLRPFVPVPPFPGGDPCRGVAAGAAREICRQYCEVENCDEFQRFRFACKKLRFQFSRLTGTHFFPCESPGFPPRVPSDTPEPLPSDTVEPQPTDTSPPPPTDTVAPPPTGTEVPLETGTPTATATDTPAVTETFTPIATFTVTSAENGIAAE